MGHSSRADRDHSRGVYSPTAEEIAKAKHIIEEYEKADVQGGLGAIVIDDQMIDAALLRVEWRKLAIARKAGLA